VFTLFLSRLADIPGALQYTPDQVRDPYLDDGVPPGGVTQIYFDSVGALERAAGELEREASRRISWFAALLQPALIVMMGAIVLVLVLAVMLPIVSMNQLVR